jgi:5-methyltetrahydrofolate--homocysteine methyltransferase
MPNNFLQALNANKVLLMDGAMGTQLQRAGIQQGECFELWNLTHPNSVLAIHRAYVAAGAQVLLTNTFQARAAPLVNRGLLQQIDDIRFEAVRLAREAAQASNYVLVSLGPGEWHSSNIDRGCFGAFQNADGLLLETRDELHSVPACISAQKKVLGAKALPVLASLTFHHEAAGGIRTFLGESPEAIAQQAAKIDGLAALGVNCGRDIDMDDVIEVIRRYRAVIHLPLFARPNAGTPTRVDGEWVYPHTPEQMAARLPALLAAGAVMVGGCCGTTPAHIAAFRRVIDEWSAKKRA